jgi:hypothetical protein
MPNEVGMYPFQNNNNEVAMDKQETIRRWQPALGELARGKVPA